MHLINKIQITTFLLIILQFSSVIAQQNGADDDAFNKGSLEEQFNYTLDNSRTYVNNKVVKIEWLKLLQKNVLQKEDNLLEEIKQLKANSNELATSISELEDQLAEVKTQLKNTQLEVEDISFIGMEMSKSLFKILFLSVVTVITALLLVFIYKFRQSNTITKDVKQKLLDSENELEDLRKKKREKEQELMRKLQDEINKHS